MFLFWFSFPLLLMIPLSALFLSHQSMYLKLLKARNPIRLRGWRHEGGQIMHPPLSEASPPPPPTLLLTLSEWDFLFSFLHEGGHHVNDMASHLFISVYACQLCQVKPFCPTQTHIDPCLTPSFETLERHRLCFDAPHDWHSVANRKWVLYTHQWLIVTYGAVTPSRRSVP